MTVIAALPKTWEDSEGVALTFVVGNQEMCNLRCPWCVIGQRGEARALAGYKPEDYARFITRIADQERVSLVSVQGYEPLLPDAWPLTRAILEAGRAVGSTTALITNGTHLGERLGDLAARKVDGLTVSLDSAEADAHDRARGVAGAFQMTLHGIRAAMRNEWLTDRLLVASVLRPRHAHELEGMPALLAGLGIKTWVVTPLYRIGNERRPGGLVSARRDILINLLRLDQIAREQGLTMLSDDEFEFLLRGGRDGIVDLEGLRLRRLRRRDGVFRLSPDGSLSVGEEILTRVTPYTRRWLPQEDPYPLIVAARSSAHLQQRAIR